MIGKLMSRKQRNPKPKKLRQLFFLDGMAKIYKSQLKILLEDKKIANV